MQKLLAIHAIERDQIRSYRIAAKTYLWHLASAAKLDKLLVHVKIKEDLYKKLCVYCVAIAL